MAISMKCMKETRLFHKGCLASLFFDNVSLLPKHSACQTVEYKNLSFQVWDIGGQDKIRRLWRYYYTGTNAIIFVVDGNDRDRIEDAKEELMRLVTEEELRDAAVLVFSNKQDLPNSMTAAEVTEKLGLHELRRRDWCAQGRMQCTPIIRLQSLHQVGWQTVGRI